MQILRLDLADSTDTVISPNKIEVSLQPKNPILLDPNSSYSIRFHALNFDESKVGASISWDLADTGHENIAGILDRRHSLLVPLKPRLGVIDFVRISIVWDKLTKRSKDNLEDLILLLIIVENGTGDNLCLMGW